MKTSDGLPSPFFMNAVSCGLCHAFPHTHDCMVLSRRFPKCVTQIYGCHFPVPQNFKFCRQKSPEITPSPANGINHPQVGSPAGGFPPVGENPTRGWPPGFHIGRVSGGHLKPNVFYVYAQNENTHASIAVFTVHFSQSK